MAFFISEVNMTEFKRSRKTRSDSIDTAKLVTLNSLGYSMATIGEILNCHKTTVCHRLLDLEIPPADTRRAFMEDVVSVLTPAQRDWLTQQVNQEYTIKHFVKDLIIAEFNTQTKSKRKNPL